MHAPDAAPPAPSADAAPQAPAPAGWALLGVVPVDPDRPAAWEAADPRLGVTVVAYRDLGALVSPVAAGAHGAGDVTARHWEVHRALLRGSVVPAPMGVVFPAHDEVVAFLTAAYASLKGALDRVEGRWEFRLHVDLDEHGISEAMALDLVTHVYAELRRISAAAIPFPRTGKRVLSAAFLVDRASSVSFQDRVEDLARLNGSLEMDLTGPWPPYDFVQMHA
jgi:hypothetical protein